MEGLLSTGLPRLVLLKYAVDCWKLAWTAWNCWKMLNMAVIGWIWLEMADNCLKWLEMAGHSWKWKEIDGNVSKWRARNRLEIRVNRWIWLKMVFRIGLVDRPAWSLRTRRCSGLDLWIVPALSSGSAQRRALKTGRCSELDPNVVFSFWHNAFIRTHRENHCLPYVWFFFVLLGFKFFV